MKQTYILFQEPTLQIPTHTNWRMYMHPRWASQQKETFDEIQANIIRRINEILRTYHKYLITKRNEKCRWTIFNDFRCIVSILNTKKKAFSLK
jgi:hypothetical protein